MGNNMRSWNQIVSSLHDVNLQAGRDVFVWTLHSSGQFSVRSFYAALISNGVRVSQEIWKTKIPTKIRIFLWYLKKGVILRKDNFVGVIGRVIRSVLFVIYPNHTTLVF